MGHGATGASENAAKLKKAAQRREDCRDLGLEVLRTAVCGASVVQSSLWCLQLQLLPPESFAPNSRSKKTPEGMHLPPRPTKETSLAIVIGFCTDTFPSLEQAPLAWQTPVSQYWSRTLYWGFMEASDPSSDESTTEDKKPSS